MPLACIICTRTTLDNSLIIIFSSVTHLDAKRASLRQKRKRLFEKDNSEIGKQREKKEGEAWGQAVVL